MTEEANPLIDKTVLDKYRIIKEIGRGGMGIVYLATDTRLGREVALKELVLSKTITGKDRDDIISRFNREARTTSTLNHTNIVTVFDVGRDNNTYMIAMEYLPGKTLKEYLDERYNFSYDEILTVFLQIMAGLSHAHSKGVVHRDIKPENITIMPEGNVKIMDFGIAAIESSNSNLTQDGSILGTIAYISPEQLYNSKRVDNRADIFSLGVMMYELFTGHLPFGGDSVGETITKIMTTVPKSPREYNENLPERLSEVVMRCLKREPGDRFQTINEISQVLMDFKMGLSFQELNELIETDADGKRPRRLTSNSNRPSIINASLTERRFRLLYLGTDIALERMLLSNIKLKGLPYELISYSDLKTAQQKLSSYQSADWVIAQLTPDNSDQVYAYFEYFKDTPISFVSELVDPTLIIDAMKRGAADFVMHSNHVDDSLKLLDTVAQRIRELGMEMPKIPAEVKQAMEQAQLTKKATSPAELSDAASYQGETLRLQWKNAFGQLGDGQGDLSSPRHIQYSVARDVLVVSDTKNGRLQCFTPDGKFVQEIRQEGMIAPCGSCSDSQGNIYAVDAVSAHVFAFDAEGKHRFTFAGKGENVHELSSVYGIICFQDRALLVSDPDAHVVKVFDLEGQMQHILGKGYSKGHSAYKKPSALSTDQQQVYLLDQGASIVYIWDQDFKEIQKFGKRGTGKGQLGVPKGISANANYVLISEALPHRFQVFSPRGEHLLSFGKKGKGQAEFNTVDDLVIHEQNVFVLDKENHRVQHFSLTS